VSTSPVKKKDLVYLCLKVLFNQFPAGILAHGVCVMHQREMKEQTSAADSSCSNHSQFTNTLHIRNAKPPRLCLANFMSLLGDNTALWWNFLLRTEAVISP
jgi:hypothetical protein